MSARDYYPAGAYDDPDAPYNQSEPPAIERTCEVVETISRTVEVSTTNYAYYPPEPWNGIYSGEYDTENVDWQEEYDEQYLSLVGLIANMRDLLLKLDTNTLSRHERHLLKRVLEESEGWEEVETDVTLNV